MIHFHMGTDDVMLTLKYIALIRDAPFNQFTVFRWNNVYRKVIADNAFSLSFLFFALDNETKHESPLCLLQIISLWEILMHV